MSMATKGLLQLKSFVPVPLKRRAKEALLNRTLRQAISKIARLPPGEAPDRLLPIMGDRLPAGSVILLDDATRSGEAEVLRRWTAEGNVDVATRTSPNGSFAVITRN
jgi:hypothetical protein